MPSLSKYEGKDRRRQRLRNHIARDLMSPKYRQRVVPMDRKRKDSENNDGTYWFEDTIDEED